MLRNLVAHDFQLARVKDNEHSNRRDSSIRRKASPEAAVTEAGIGWSVVGEFPIEDRRIKPLGFGDIRGRKLDVVNASILFQLAHC